MLVVLVGCCSGAGIRGGGVGVGVGVLACVRCLVWLLLLWFVVVASVVVVVCGCPCLTLVVRRSLFVVGCLLTVVSSGFVCCSWCLECRS